MCAQKGYYDELMKLLTHYEIKQGVIPLGELIQTKDKEGETALAWAVIRSKHKCAEALIAKGANPNTYNNAGKSPLDHTESTKDPEMVSLLSTPQITAYSGGIIKAVKDAKGAAEKGDLDQLIKLLKQKDFPVTKQTNSLIVLAVQFGNVHIVQYLIEKYNVSHNERDKHGQSLIELAIVKGQVSVVEYLIKILETRHELTDQIVLALVVFAIKNKQMRIVDYFVDKRILKEIELWRVNVQNQTLLTFAQQNGSPETVAYLREKGALTEDAVKTKQKIFTAAKGNNKAEVEALMQRWRAGLYRINQLKDKDGNTPLHWAVEGEAYEVIEFLLKLKSHGEDDNSLVNVPNQLGQTPLDVADLRGTYIDVRIPKLLRENRAQNFKDLTCENKGAEKVVASEVNPKRYAFQYARIGNVQELKNILQKSHVTPDETDENGDTLLAIAAQAGKRDIVILLVDKFQTKVATLNKQKKSPIALAANDDIRKYLEGKLQECVIAAIVRGQLDIVKDLVENHVTDVNVVINKQTYLDYAIKNLQVDIESYLRSKNALTAEMISYRNFILLLARKKNIQESENDRNEFARALQAWHNGRGKPEQLRDADGNTPLHCAADANAFETLKFLIFLRQNNQQKPYFSLFQTNNSNQNAYDYIKDRQDPKFETLKLFLAKQLTAR